MDDVLFKFSQSSEVAEGELPMGDTGYYALVEGSLEVNLEWFWTETGC